MSGAFIGLILLAFLAAVAACAVFVRRWRAEQAEVERVRSTFSRYVPPAIVNELLDRKDEKLFTGREVRVTIMVCRIWNFPQFIERLTPEQTLRYLNEFYAMAGASIQRQHGILHRFLEDGVVGIFGVPLPDYDQEDHALRAAINIARLVAVMEEKWASQNRRPLRVGIGINTGDVIAGDAGFAQRREYMVVGPDVTLAHILQGATIDLNASIVASRATVDPVRERYNLVPVSGVPVNGVRALLDASIVRGRKRGDTLVYPKAGAFANTVIDDAGIAGSLDPHETVPFDVVAEHAGLAALDDPSVHERLPAAPGVAETAPAVPDASEYSAPLKTRRRARPATTAEQQQQFGLDLPELRMPSFAQGDEEPIYPDPPSPRATYEDNDGPPIPL
jgi:class 3 adenylate cyclase